MTTRVSKTGRTLTDTDLDAIAEEVESTDFDVEALKTRRRGCPTIGSGPASEIIRAALREFLDVA